MRIEDLNWMDVEAYLRHEDRLIIVLGATEQHGYLSLASDVRIPMALADAASEKTGVLVAPASNFGVSPYFLTYPGTISLRLSTFLDVVEDLARSVYGYGFRRLLFLNGHGGNEPARGRLTEVANQLLGLKVSWYAWWLSHSVQEVAMKHNLKPSHANWLEAFPFTMVAELPGGEKAPPSVKGVLNAAETRAAYGDGSFGGAYQAPGEVMDEMFQAVLKDTLYLLDF
ncbi:MAG TPA: creatininase family protein [Anaerolineaceae bacterium]|nr:creatininase family protein [Anaerolineaceae bacterium]